MRRLTDIATTNFNWNFLSSAIKGRRCLTSTLFGTLVYVSICFSTSFLPSWRRYLRAYVVQKRQVSIRPNIWGSQSSFVAFTVTKRSIQAMAFSYTRGTFSLLQPFSTLRYARRATKSTANLWKKTRFSAFVVREWQKLSNFHSNIKSVNFSLL